MLPAVRPNRPTAPGVVVDLLNLELPGVGDTRRDYGRRADGSHRPYGTMRGAPGLQDGLVALGC